MFWDVLINFDPSPCALVPIVSTPLPRTGSSIMIWMLPTYVLRYDISTVVNSLESVYYRPISKYLQIKIKQ